MERNGGFDFQDMKKIVSVSLGSSSRDHSVVVNFNNQDWKISRIGCDGDLAACRQRYLEMDNKVDAFGMGGIDRWLWIGDRRYQFNDAAKLVAGLKTFIADGSGLKHYIESELVTNLLNEKKILKSTDKVLMVSGLDRWGMAKAFHDGGCDVLYGDLIFGLDLPIGINHLEKLARVGRTILPVVTKLPFKWLYPTGEKQEENTGKASRWFKGRDVIAGDFHYIKRNIPNDLTGKTIVTNTTTEEDVKMLKSKGLKWLVTTTPRLEGRSFGTNVIEAFFFGVKESNKLSQNDYKTLSKELDFSGNIERLNK